MRRSSDFLVKSALIAAAYAALTLLLAPISYGAMQIRVSEGLIGFAVFTPAAIPGLTIGCFLSGILGPNGILDAAIGSIATLIGAFGTYAFRKRKYIACSVNVLSNAIMIGMMLYYVYDINYSIWLCVLWVGIGEAIACYGIGGAIVKYLSTKGNHLV